MDIICTCACGARFKVGEQAAGKRARCPKCKAIVTVPASASDANRQVESVPIAAPVEPILPPPAIPTAAESESPAPLFVDQAAAAGVGRVRLERKKKVSPYPLFIGGGIAGVVLVFGLIVLLSSGKNDEPAAKGPSPKKSAEKPMATLVIDWPEEERTSAKLTIDDSPTSIPRQGRIELSVKPGKRVIGILRRDYEPVREEVHVAVARTATVKPVWKQAKQLVANAGQKVETEPENDISKVLGSAVVPRGFDGWLQLQAVAKEAAAKEKKDILMVIGSSDSNVDTSRLADSLRKAGLPKGELEKRYVPLVIDLPETDEGLNRIVDRYQNANLQKEYQATKLPVMVLADAEARPYAVQREWPRGAAQAAAEVETLAAKRADRDKLLVPAENKADEASQLDAALAMVNWVYENKLLLQYRNDVHRWYELATRLDPDDTQGKLQIVLAAELQCRIFDSMLRLQSGERDLVGLARQLDVLQPYLSERKFSNEDRGFELHVMAGGVYHELDDEQLAMSHLERANVYDPQEPQLLELKKRVAGMLSQPQNVLSSGTGFVVAEGGYVLTNKHVVDGPGKLAVRLPAIPEPVPAQLLKTHGTIDMALVKVEFPDSFQPKPVSLSNRKLSRAMEVAAFGYPQGDELGEGLKFTKGAISSLPNPALENMILLDLRVNPGNSGGPLCDVRGGVVGMITAKTGGLNLDSYGMAIPAEELDKFLTQHLPEAAVRGEPLPKKTDSDWSQVDEALSPAVLMILKIR